MNETTPAWKNVRERGAVTGMILTLLVYRLLGRRLAEGIIWFVVTYFYLTNRRARKASRDFLDRVHCPSPSHAHFMEFAINALDRFDFWVGAIRRYSFTFHGRDHLDRLQESRKGCLFFGAHVGNHDALRALAVEGAVKVQFLTDLQSSRLYAGVLKRFCPRAETGTVEYDNQQPHNILSIKSAVERGEIVGLLADRVVAESRRGAQRIMEIPFLGKKAVFSKNPFILASLLKCPVFFFAAVRTSRWNYDLFIDKITDGDDDFQRIASFYVQRLEKFSSQFPLHWFNFYDFWRTGI